MPLSRPRGTSVRRVVDLYCPTCNEVEADAYVSASEMACKCGATRTVYWGSAQNQRSTRADGFVPVTFGGVKYDSPDAWAACRKSWKSSHGEDLDVVGDSVSARRRQVEEAHHAAIQQAKRRGGFDHAIADLNRTSFKDRR